MSFDEEAFCVVYSGWVEEALKVETRREPAWSESVAVGGKKYVERIKEELGFRAIGIKIHKGLKMAYSGTYFLNNQIVNSARPSSYFLVVF
ncbi:MAG: hypothetical protein KQH63_01330 [Desulfobulbaceae bacterium]|nr:hypothetical protein [Desulfobulbaceae bacterium]